MPDVGVAQSRRGGSRCCHSRGGGNPFSPRWRERTIVVLMDPRLRGDDGRDRTRPIADMGGSCQNRAMARLSVLILVPVLAGCSVKQPSPDLCNMPMGLRGWGGATLRLTGIVVGGFPDGFTMMDERCPRGGKLKVTEQTIQGELMLNRLRKVGSQLGVTRMTVEAKIETLDGAPPTLRVIRYFASSFQPMTERQLIDFDRKRGL